MTHTYTQKIAVRNYVYGLTFWESLGEFERELSNLDRAESLWDAIERYWPNAARCYEIIISLKTDISNIDDKKWLHEAFRNEVCRLVTMNTESIKNSGMPEDMTIRMMIDMLCPKW